MKKHLIKVTLIWTALITLSTVSKAQTFPWAKGASGTGGDEGFAVCTDASGNIFIAGEFNSPTITFGTYTLTNGGNYDVFIAKYDPSGNVLWAKSASTSGIDAANSLCADASGNIFVTGSFFGPSITFGTYTLTNTGGPDVFVVKYDNNGNVLWAKNPTGSSTEIGHSISVDVSGNALVTGYFFSSPLTIGTYTLTNSGASDVFLAKYDTNGNILWAKSGGSSTTDDVNSVVTNSLGEILITGSFAGPTIAFGTSTLTNSGGIDAFIVKYDINGNVIWAKNPIGSSSDVGFSMSVDGGANIFVTGYFYSPTITFGTYTLTNTGGSDVFLAKYDTNGNVLFAKSATGSKNDIGYSLSSYNGDVFLAGSTGTLSITFGTYTLTAPAGSTDPMFIVQYDLNGNVIYATSLSSGGDDINAVAVDKFCNAYISGDYTTNPFVVGTNSLTLTGGENIFLTKFSFSCQSDGINQSIKLIQEVKIYPNPNNGSFKLQIDNEIQNGEIILINSLGQKVHSQKIFQGENNIITRDLASGLYNCIILRDKGQISNRKLTVE